MPITQSAKKAVRQSAARRSRNFEIRESYKKSIKVFMKAAKEGKKEELQAMVNQAYSQIDRALKKNIMHANTAARKKARIAKIASGVASGKVDMTSKKVKAKKEKAVKAD